ncbi:cofactor-independent phosphoglycerate mutase [Puteibacter caeruleilacunae]|nr:cofactor-independent phosphoglycerate mutase [Puteibacter caeruleilacunae]
MKYLIILGDGMADEPNDQLGGKTPLMVAQTPNIDRLASEGNAGLLETVPEGMHPGSEIANMAVMGYDVANVYEGRGVLEAASIGVELQEGDVAFRCNLVCIENGILKNHSAGHISTEEADELIKYLQEEMGNEMTSFYTGVSYRHLLVMHRISKSLDCTPPHDVPGTPFEDILIKPLNDYAVRAADMLNDMILRSMELLEVHPINLKRISEGKDPANAIWPWSPGHKPKMPTLKDAYGIDKSAVISAVDLIQGIGVYAGMDVLKVEGATGLYDTNYEGKTEAALNALKDHDYVYLHIEASDEAGHEGDVDLKVKTIENLDSRVVGPVLDALAESDLDVTVALLPDHPTPCAIRTHTRKPVPFIIRKPDERPDVVNCYNEDSVAKGSYGELKGAEFMKALLS